MSKEFYNYIAKRTVSYFQEKADSLQPGERFCLILDNSSMVLGVSSALSEYAKDNNLCGEYRFKDVYSTDTIKLSAKKELVIASKTNGMTDDFLTKLRNTDLTDNRFPILIITDTTIDSIISGSGDMSAKGMPFHAKSIINRIHQDIDASQLSVYDSALLQFELKNKEDDKYSDKSSLFEYKDILAVIGRGYIEKADYSGFELLPDPDFAHIVDNKKIQKRLLDNHKHFETINRAFTTGNIQIDLEKEYDASFVKQLVEKKKKNEVWYQDYTLAEVISAKERLKKKLNNPLQLEEKNLTIYAESPLEYSFDNNNYVLFKYDGDSKAKKRKINLLIFNPDHKTVVTIDVQSNVLLKQSDIETYGANKKVSGKTISLSINSNNCCFAKAILHDITNGINYEIRICVVDLHPTFLESIQTSYIINVPNSLKNARIHVLGINNSLVINPGNSVTRQHRLSTETNEINCNYNESVELLIDSDSIDYDKGFNSIKLVSGAVEIPVRIYDEKNKAVELTGLAAYALKYDKQKSIEYRGNNKIIAGTTEYYARDKFKNDLEIEQFFISNDCVAVKNTGNGLEALLLSIPDSIREKYQLLVSAIKEKRSLPSLVYYDDKLSVIASNYIEAFETEITSIVDGTSLSEEQSDMLLIGSVFESGENSAIKLGPLHPINVMYQLALSKEESVGKTKENILNKLNSLYLLPYIRNQHKELFATIEQAHSPEWHYYAPITNKRYNGARNYVQRLVNDKIRQYKDHFTFLFDDIGNSEMTINLINMGDCKEVLHGIIKFFASEIRSGKDNDEILSFKINVYAEVQTYNELFSLSDTARLKYHINESQLRDDIDLNEMVLVLTSHVKCYFKSSAELKYEYSHLSFFEMATSSETNSSRMDSIITGSSLGGLLSGVPSVLSSSWYKTGFGSMYAGDNRLIRLSKAFNAAVRVAYSGSSFDSNLAVFTEIQKGQESVMEKIYDSSNWVVFIEPKVDLSFFKDSSEEDLMIIHYSDQYTSASGYDDITVTKKTTQYNDIILEQLAKKGVFATKDDTSHIISLFNAVNGDWLLRLISSKKLAGAADSVFSREKMSILSAIKLCMAYYNHPDIVWIPISLEEMLRVSGGVGYSQNDGILSAKNLGFEQRATSDDILLIGIEGPINDIKVYIHPVEVKIGINNSAVIKKANDQVIHTYEGFMNALCPEEMILENKLARNFLMQLVMSCCEKMKLYEIYPDENWDLVLKDWREKLLNEQYSISKELEPVIGKGTVILFTTDVHDCTGELGSDGVCQLEFPEKTGSSYMVQSAIEIEKELAQIEADLPERLKVIYKPTNDNNDDSQNETPIPIKGIAETESLLDENNDSYPNDNSADAIDLPNNENSEESGAEKHDSKGIEVVLGKDITSGEPVVWNPNDTNQIFHSNTGIIGTMGTGKTQFTKSLVAQMYLNKDNNIGDSDLGVLIFDYKGDYNESKNDFVELTKAKVYKPYHLPFNPLAITKSSVFRPLLPVHTANAFKDTLAKVYNLGPKQQNTLTQCINDAYWEMGIMPNNEESWSNTAPTFSTVYRIYQNDEDIKKNDSLAAALDKLAMFEIFEPSPENTKSLFDLLHGVVVIDLSGYDSDIQNLVVAITLNLFYSQMQAAGSSKMNGSLREITKVILVDEADNFMSQDFSSLKKILKEGREFGVGTILSTQFLKHFATGEDDYAKYILTWVVHNVSDLKNSDVDFVFKTEPKSDLSQRLFKDIKNLNKHMSIIKIGNNQPQYIKDRAFWELCKEIGS